MKIRWLTANTQVYPTIKELRYEIKQNMTPAEQIMWELLRNKKTGHKIRRQHIVENYIADFVCIKKRLVIEIDGKIHLKRKVADKVRTLSLNQSGWDVIRFTNEEVIENPETVAMKIKSILDVREDWKC